MIVERSGNLLRDDAQALVNTVNTVGVMGKGLALQFRRAFPDNYEAYLRACADGVVQPGKVFVTPFGEGRWVLNFPTKRHWRQRSRIEDIRDGLDDLIRILKDLRIESIAVPPLGCGNGGLPWDVVRPLIIEKLAPLDVTVHLYGPGTPSPEDMIRSEAPSKLTPSCARVLLGLRRYIATSLSAGVAVDARTSLLEAHKVTYLMQAAGSGSQFEFEPGHYGPYSPNLDRAISRMEGHYLVGFGDGTGGARADLRLLPASDDTDVLISDHDGISQAWDRVAAIATGYEYPDGMELLATVHYLATQGDTGSVIDPEEVARQVANWSDRKRRLFPAEDVTQAWFSLEGGGLLRPNR